MGCGVCACVCVCVKERDVNFKIRPYKNDFTLGNCAGLPPPFLSVFLFPFQFFTTERLVQASLSFWESLVHPHTSPARWVSSVPLHRSEHKGPRVRVVPQGHPATYRQLTFSLISTRELGKQSGNRPWYFTDTAGPRDEHGAKNDPYYRRLPGFSPPPLHSES